MITTEKYTNWLLPLITKGNNKMIEIIVTSATWGIIVFLVWKVFRRKINVILLELKEAKFKLKSGCVRFGKSFEHFVPFTSDFPADKEKTVFLGMPIDFISFDKDSIKFIEVKTGQSQLSLKQKRIKKQIENGNVKFEEVRY